MSVQNLALPDLTDVSDTLNPSLSDVLKYNTTSSQWEAGQIALGNLSNVFYTTPNDLDVLQFKTSTPAGPKWTPSALTIPTTLDSLSNVVCPSPATNDLLTFDGSNWINAPPIIPPSALNDLSDVTISAPTNGQLLTYSNVGPQWVNAVKPTYTIAEQTDFSGVPANGDYMAFDSSDGKWKPAPIQMETLSYMRIIQTADNISINFTTDAGFNKYNLFQTALANHSLVFVGTDISRVNDYTLQINTTGAYHLGLSATSEQANMNFTLVRNNVLTAYAARGDNNSCTSFSLFTQLAAGDLLNFCSDVAGGTIRNVIAYIRYIPINKKIVNTVVNTGTSLELLSDTQITNPKTQGQVISWDATASKWVNNGVSISGSSAEYFRINTTSGIGSFGPNTTTEFGVANALNLFTAATSGINLIDTSRSTNIITIINGR